MTYCIGDFDILWTPEHSVLKEDALMRLFRARPGSREELRYYEVPMEPSIIDGAKVLQHSGGFELLETSRGYFLLNHWGSCRSAYGFFPEELGADTPIYCDPRLSQQLPLSMSRFFSTVGLHRKLLEHRAPVLHAAYVAYRGKALLFLGPSGTGKSTQAELWRQFAGAQILNGDRVLLRKTVRGWQSYGYPCCGSSDICVNETLPLAAMVFLQQAGENRLEEMTEAEKIRSLAAATELYPWDIWEVEQALRLGQQLAGETPTVRLCCRPERAAVELLNAFVEENT